MRFDDKHEEFFRGGRQSGFLFLFKESHLDAGSRESDFPDNNPFVNEEGKK